MSFFEMLGQLNKGVQEKDIPTDSKMTRRLNVSISTRPPERTRMALYVTDTARLCLRRMVLKVLRPEAVDTVPADLQKIFDIGKVTNDWWQNEYYGPMGVLIGDWKCRQCGRTQNGRMPQDPCGECGRLVWRYKETGIGFEAHGLTLRGRVDGIFNDPEPMVLEMKTKRSVLWSEMKRPEYEHIVQASIYAECLGLNTIFLSYISKDTWRTKDYIIQKDSEAVQRVRETMRQVSEIVTGGNAESAPKACKNASAAKRRGCGYAGFCFA